MNHMGATQRRRIWFMLLAVTLLVSVVAAGCSSSNKGGSTDNPGNNGKGSSDLFTISVYVNSPFAAPTPDNKVYRKIEQELGVKLEIETLVGDAEQKLGVLIAGGEYPDLVSAHTKLVDAKAVIPLEDLIEEHAPRLREHYAPYWNRMKDSSDGHIYWLPNFGAYHGEITA